MAVYGPHSFFFFLSFLELGSASVHKQAKTKKELGQYPAILNEKAWSTTNMYTSILETAIKSDYFLWLFFVVKYVFLAELAKTFKQSFFMWDVGFEGKFTHSYTWQQERMMGERVNPSYKPLSQGYPPKVIFRHGTQFFRTIAYFTGLPISKPSWDFFPGNNLKWITMKQKPVWAKYFSSYSLDAMYSLPLIPQ